MLDLKSKLKNQPEYVFQYLMETYKLTQKDLAFNLDLTQQYINDIHKGRRKLTPNILKKLQNLFPMETRDFWSLIHKTCAQREGWNV